MLRGEGAPWSQQANGRGRLERRTGAPVPTMECVAVRGLWERGPAVAVIAAPAPGAPTPGPELLP